MACGLTLVVFDFVKWISIFWQTRLGSWMPDHVNSPPIPPAPRWRVTAPIPSGCAEEQSRRWVKWRTNCDRYEFKATAFAKPWRSPSCPGSGVAGCHGTPFDCRDLSTSSLVLEKRVSAVEPLHQLLRRAQKQPTRAFQRRSAANRSAHSWFARAQPLRY